MQMSKKIKILIIEDIADQIQIIRSGINQILGRENVEIFPKYENDQKFSNELSTYACDNNMNGLYEFANKEIIKNKIDLLVLDLKLCANNLNENAQNNSGTKLLEKFLASGDIRISSLPVIICSQYSEDEIAKGAATMIPYAYIQKTADGFTSDEFKRSLEQQGIKEWLTSIVISYRNISECLKKNLQNAKTMSTLKQVINSASIIMLPSDIKELINIIKSEYPKPEQNMQQVLNELQQQYDEQIRTPTKGLQLSIVSAPLFRLMEIPVIQNVFTGYFTNQLPTLKELL